VQNEEAVMSGSEGSFLPEFIYKRGTSMKRTNNIKKRILSALLAVFLLSLGSCAPETAKTSTGGAGETGATVVTESTKTQESLDQSKQRIVELINQAEAMPANEMYSAIQGLLKYDTTYEVKDRYFAVEKVFELGMEQCYQWNHLEKAESILSALFETLQEETYVVPELAGKNPEEVLTWQSRDKADGSIQNLSYLDAKKEFINFHFRKAVDKMLAEVSWVAGYRYFSDNVASSADRKYITPYTVNGVTYTEENFYLMWKKVILDQQADPKYWIDLKNGDFLYLGSYEQDNNLENGAEPILWKVLYREGDKLYCRSAFVLEALPWNENGIVDTENPFRWDVSTLRKWLNEDFYEAAFSNEEKARIALSHLKNNWNLSDYTPTQIYKTPLGDPLGGEDTQDWVYVDTVSDYISLTQWAPTDFYGNLFIGASDYAKAKFGEGERIFSYTRQAYGKESEGKDTFNTFGPPENNSSMAWSSRIILNPNEVNGVQPSITIQIPAA